MKEAFVVKRFSHDKKVIIDLVNDILSEYQAEGYDLTVRQVYYQFVARDFFPDERKWRQIPDTNKWVKDPNGTKNAEPNYKWLAEILTEARMAGLIDWDMIVDRGRETVTPPAWEDPAEIVNAAADSFALDKWKDQTNHVEVMVEKQALEGVLIPVCERLGIRFTANKGFSSASSLYEAGKRLYQKSREGKTPWVLYLGDHDPSGMDMTRDVEERLNLFAGLTWVYVDRLALNMDQIEDLNLPPAPAKITDSRSKGYIARFGNDSWELDALEPRRLAGLVTDAVERLRDNIAWSEAVKREESMRKELRDFVDAYQRGQE